MPALADAVDSPGAPAPSFLAPGANTAAQALLKDATLRSLSAVQLAGTLHLSLPDVRAGMGAVVAMVNRGAHGDAATGALSPSESIARAIGPFMNLDTALARYGAHMGPITFSPSPLYRPDRSYDRAGAYDGYAGDVQSDLSAAATQAFDFLSQNGCSASPAGIVSNFQLAYFRATGIRTYDGAVPDDEYGPRTRAALQKVLDASGGGIAPAACSYSTRPAPGPAPGPAPMLTGGGWGWGLAAALAAVLLLRRSKHPPAWVVKLGVPKL